MDELVRQALAKWPNVPDCTGWLALDARGRWRIGEVADGPRQPITHAATIAYLNRNYLQHGRCWMVQNGPQRVFVELEYTPFVWRLAPRDPRAGPGGGGWDFVAHTGQVVVPRSLWLDDAGRFLADAGVDRAAASIGVIHDHDTALVTELLRDERGDAIDDDRLVALSSLPAAAFDATSAPATAATTFRWVSMEGEAVALPLGRIAASQVPMRFGFEPRPSVTLRVDLDTRR